MLIPYLIATLLLLALLATLWRRWARAARAEFIRGYRFPQGVFVSLKRKHPHLQDKDCQLVAQALRQFFLVYLKSGRRYVSMPSQAVDEVWHDFILNTRAYSAFCSKAFGGFMHHRPAAVMGSNRQSNEGLRRCWWHACREENLDPRRASRLPLLFAIDAKLQIADGFHYVADCRGLSRDNGSGVVHCGGDFSDASLDGGTDGFGDSAADGSGDSGCGGGCGGD